MLSKLYMSLAFFVIIACVCLALSHTQFKTLFVSLVPDVDQSTCGTRLFLKGVGLYELARAGFVCKMTMAN